MTGGFKRFNGGEADFAESNRCVLAHQGVVGSVDVFAGTHACRRLCSVLRSARKKGW